MANNLPFIFPHLRYLSQSLTPKTHLDKSSLEAAGAGARRTIERPSFNAKLPNCSRCPMHPAISPSNFHAPPMPVANTPSTFPFLPFFIFCFILLSFFSIFVFLDLRYYLSAVRSSVVRGGGGNAMALQSNKPGLDPAIIASFPLFRYAEVRRLIEEKYGSECAVCLSDFAADDVLRLLTVCCHAFHQVCIDSWFYSHKTCPICRLNVEEVPNEATVTVLREVVAGDSSGGGDDEDNCVVRVEGAGERAEVDGEHVLLLEGGAMEQNSEMSPVNKTAKI